MCYHQFYIFYNIGEIGVLQIAKRRFSNETDYKKYTNTINLTFIKFLALISSPKVVWRAELCPSGTKCFKLSMQPLKCALLKSNRKKQQNVKNKDSLIQKLEK